MNEHLEKVFEAPVPVRVGITVGAVLLLVATYWFAFHGDLHAEVARVESEIQAKNVEIVEKRAIAQNLPKFEAEVDRLDIELKKALAELPDKKEISMLLEKVADKAKEAGLDVRLFRPRVEQKKDFYAEVPVEVEVAGGFHQVAAFFDEVGHMERIVNIDNFGMTEPRKAESGLFLKTSLVATSFRFLDESERPKEDETGKGSKRRKKKAAAKPSTNADEL